MQTQSGSDSRWYAARSKPNQERIALDHLQQQNFKTYYPQLRFTKAKRGKLVSTTEGLFPGYVFVYFLLDPCAWRSINGTRGIVRLLSFSQDGKPSAVPDGQIEVLQHQEKTGEFPFLKKDYFAKGDMIRVKNGPYNGHMGSVLRSRGERVEFLLRLLGRQVRCIAPMHTLSLV